MFDGTWLQTDTAELHKQILEAFTLFNSLCIHLFTTVRVIGLAYTLRF